MGCLRRANTKVIWSSRSDWISEVSVHAGGVDVAEGLGVEHQPPHRGRGPVEGCADPGLDGAGAGEEQPVVQAVDEHPGG